jgi:hypothetical protein
MIGTATTLPIYYVTTFEMFRKPIIGFIFRKLFCIPKKRYLSDSQATRDIVKVINERSVVLVFPEGERSWTGRFGTCKPQVLKLLKHYHQVPVVPIQIEGNYHAWPRWRTGVRKSHISLNVGEPIIFQSEASVEQIDREIRRAIIPLDTDARCSSEDRVEGLEHVLYRCPRCGVFDSLHKKGENILVCSQCSLDIALTPTYTLIFRAEEFSHLSSIPDVYDSIRIRSNDIRAIAVPNDLEHAFGHGKDEWLIAFSRQATYFVEDGMTLRRKGKRTLLVTNRHVIISHEHNSVEIPLDTISSVTIESNYKLQMYQQNPPQLHQLTFEYESALKWQDYLDETILSVCHRTINRT